MSDSKIREDLKCHSATILVQLSDEMCNFPRVFRWYHRFGHIYRQYACWSRYSKLYRGHEGRITMLPLGYSNMLRLRGTTMETVARSLSTVDRERQYIWSFAGSLKKPHGERQQAVSVFKSLKPFFLSNPAVKHSDTQVLTDSYFVLSPRGQVSVDCFRHYEASMHGAIPIVVGLHSELVSAFNYFAVHPPWVFAASWVQALQLVQGLLANRTAMVARQIAVLQWWKTEWFSLKRSILDVLHLNDSIPTER